MSKMSELAAEIAELRKCAETIIGIADSFTEMFSGNDEPANAPATESALTLEAVRAVLADKSRNGHTARIRSLLQKYGASRLSEIDPVNYKALLAEAEVLA
ncbi:DNA ligase [Dehalococcoides mccartyi]|uniref:DNA ligase n=1 Tax=Dehalococcoides mccartyi TaxID=61435 RepID=UPI000994ADDA|nr:DNA ligase [Dehalococcoides mccartyi]AQW61925.1 DNA ligase [Dehalococcoides mccartyi]